MAFLDTYMEATDGKVYLVRKSDFELVEKMQEMFDDYTDSLLENALRLAIYRAEALKEAAELVSRLDYKLPAMRRSSYQEGYGDALTDAEFAILSYAKPNEEQ